MHRLTVFCSRVMASLQVSQEAQAPSGCAVNVVDDITSVCLMLKGVLDPVKEAAKLKEKQVRQGLLPTVAHQLTAGKQHVSVTVSAVARCVSVI